MDLQEEYFVRRGVLGHLVKFCDRGHLVLKARENLPKKPDWEWLSVTIAQQPADQTHASYHQFQVAANPVIYANSDFSSITHHHSKLLADTRVEFDKYESFMIDWAADISLRYQAVEGDDAMFVSWEMFCVNYDSWLANFLTVRMVECLANTLIGDKEERKKNICEVETWLRERYEKVFMNWKSIRLNLEAKHYSNWLARIVNNMHSGVFTPWTAQDFAQATEKSKYNV